MLPDEENVEDAEESFSATSSVETPDSSVVSDTDSDASAGDRDVSDDWIRAIEAAIDMESDEHLQFLLMELRKQRNHFPPSDAPPPSDCDSRWQHARSSVAQAPAIAIRNAFQTLDVMNDEADESEEDDVNLPALRATSVSTRVQCRYLKVMIKMNMSDIRCKRARKLFEQKRWLDAAKLFVTAHDHLFDVVVIALSRRNRFRVSLLHFRCDMTIGGRSHPNTATTPLLTSRHPTTLLFCLKSCGR
jgi:hypothetical protein